MIQKNIDDCIWILKDWSRVNKNYDKFLKHKNTYKKVPIKKKIKSKKQQKNKSVQLENSKNSYE